MGGEPPARDLQREIDDFSGRTAANAVRIEAASDGVNDPEVRADIDREMTAALQAEGIVSQQHAARLHEALVSSRTIGVAMGLLMAGRGAPHDQALDLLREASQRSNRTMSDIAAELVERANHRATAPAAEMALEPEHEADPFFGPDSWVPRSQ